MEITNKLKAKIFGLYPNANAIPYDDMERIGKATAVGFEENEEKVRISSPGKLGIVHRWYDVQDVQIILTPLEEISDEDCIAAYDVDCDAETIRLTKNEIKIKKFRDELKSGVIATYRVADLLRSKGYALPAFGVQDLYEAGIAVKPKNEQI